MLRSLPMALVSLLTASLALGQSESPTSAVESGLLVPRTEFATRARRSEAKEKSAATVAEQKQSVLKQDAEPPQQVVVRLTIAELSRNQLREIQTDVGGIDMQQLAASGLQGLMAEGILDSIEQPDAQPESSDAGASQAVGYSVLNDARRLDGLMEALGQTGALKILAEPTLATLCGRRAFVRIGGEVPLSPPHGEDGATDASRGEIGAQVECIPTALGDGRIQLKIRARVTELDESCQEEANDGAPPELQTVVIATQVEMRSGQTVVLGGIVTRRSIADANAPTESDEESDVVELVATVRCDLASVPQMASRAPAPK